MSQRVRLLVFENRAFPAQENTMQSSSLVVRRELLESVTDLTERGLYYAAKWYVSFSRVQRVIWK